MKRTPLTIIFLIVFIDLLGFGIIIPILPSYAQRGFGTSDIMVGVLIAVYSVMQLLFTPILGRISDRMGRKPVLIVGLACSVVGYVLFGLAHSFAMLFLARCISGIGGANISAAQAYIADVTTTSERARGMGLVGAAFGLGFVFGPFLGGVLSEYGYEVPGFAAAALSFIALLTTIAFLPEPANASDKTAMPPFDLDHLLNALRKPMVGPLLFLFFLITFGFANIYATFPLLSTRDFGYSDKHVGYFFATIGFVGALTQGVLIKHLTKRFREEHLFTVGSVLMMVGLAGIPFHVHEFIFPAIIVVMAFGAGIVTPVSFSLISQHSSESEQGGILGISQSLNALGRVLGPVWGSFVFQQFGHGWPFFTAAGVMLVVLVLSRRWL